MWKKRDFSLKKIIKKRKWEKFDHFFLCLVGVVLSESLLNGKISNSNDLSRVNRRRFWSQNFDAKSICSTVQQVHSWAKWIACLNDANENHPETSELFNLSRVNFNRCCGSKLSHPSPRLIHSTRQQTSLTYLVSDFSLSRATRIKIEK